MHTVHVFQVNGYRVETYSDEYAAGSAFARACGEPGVTVAVFYLNGQYVNDYSAERAEGATVRAQGGR